MIKRTTMAAVLSILSLVGAARAEGEHLATLPQNGKKLDDASSVAISGDFSMALRHYEMKPFASYTTVMVHPALDYFVVDHVSVGGGVGVGYSASTYGNELQLSAGPRVGYDIPIGDRFSMWPTVGVTYTRLSMSFDGQAPHSWMLNAVASADLIGQIAPHFFMGFGPYVTGELAQNGSFQPGLGYGLSSTLGGWL